MGTTKANRELEVEYPRAFGQAMSSILGEREGNGERKFRYVHLSGGMTERDQERSLWFKGDMRRMKVRFSLLYHVISCESLVLW